MGVRLPKCKGITKATRAPPHNSVECEKTSDALVIHRRTVGIVRKRRIAFVDRQDLAGEWRLADAIAMPEGASAPGHAHLLYPGCYRSRHEGIRPEHSALKCGIKGHALGRGLSPQAQMAHWPGLGGEVLNGIDPLHRPLAVGTR
jgi:hypothetical protein